MPYYGYKGRLAYFSYFKNHIGLYLTPPIIEEFKKELKDYGTSTATIRFPHKEKLPVALIKKLIKARMKRNYVTFTIRVNKIRVISARDQDIKERREYEKK